MTGLEVTDSGEIIIPAAEHNNISARFAINAIRNREGHSSLLDPDESAVIGYGEALYMIAELGDMASKPAHAHNVLAAETLIELGHADEDGLLLQPIHKALEQVVMCRLVEPHFALESASSLEEL
jgi:hypothetical protein